MGKKAKKNGGAVATAAPIVTEDSPPKKKKLENKFYEKELTKPDPKVRRNGELQLWLCTGRQGAAYGGT